MANYKIPFMKWRTIGFTLSAVVVSSCLYFWFSSGTEKYGLDFMGGSEVVVRITDSASISDIRSSLEEGGIKDSVVQTFGDDANDYSIRVKSNKDTKASKR